MAISVDTVYKTVLLILNKEQRGYITPNQFNKLATQVQLEIFEKYFEDIHQQIRLPENDTEYGNRIKNVDDKISIFKDITSLSSNWLGTNEFSEPATIHRIGTVIYKDEQELQRVRRNDWLNINMSKLTRPTADYPIYLYENNKIIIQPPNLVREDPLNPGTIFDEFSVSYIRKPLDVNWAFNILGNGAYSYDPIASTDFEIDDTEQTMVVIDILKYAGVIIRDPQIVQAAAQESQLEEQNTKT